MGELNKRLKKTFSKYIHVINLRTLVSVLISIFATWLSYRYKFIFNLDLTLISVAVVFPLVFTLGSAFQRREKALEHLGRTKAALSAIKYCFSYTEKIVPAEKERIYNEVDNVKKELIAFLYSESDHKEKLNQSISNIQTFIETHKADLGRSLSLRVYKLMRDVIMGIENAMSIKLHRTPHSIRAYCKLFIYVFPFFYAPTLIKNIQFHDAVSAEIVMTPALSIFESHLVLIVYGLNIVLSFFLITLFNIQDQIENPFDQDGMDDIMLDNYIIDY